MVHKQFLLLAINNFAASNGWLKFRVWKECGKDASLEDCYEYYTRLKSHSSSSKVKNLSRLMRNVEVQIRLMERYKIAMRILGEPDYPAMLTMIEDPPFLLYVRGKMGSLNEPAFGLVGTRKPTITARRQAFEISFNLASANLPIVSGMAYGIDAAVHEGALEAGGRTWAVLAGGLDRPGPYGHRRMAERIIDNQGALVGEIYPGYFPVKYAFHKRNRILSGLSQSVVIVQAPKKSGALITARFAIEQNRNVFVASAGLNGMMSMGTRDLHSQGAPEVRNAADVFKQLNINSPDTELKRIQNPRNGADLAHIMEGELNGRLKKYMGVWYAH